MKIATLLFTYNRSYHTEQVLQSLKQNTVLPQRLFVFQDGRREYDNVKEWERVNRLICDIDWCQTEIIVSSANKGLANSILDGIQRVFEQYDAVIVLEDDCVLAVNFISFMQQCFKKYQNVQKVYSVSGYSYPVELERGPYDIYGCGRISSWGWGTWKDRWAKFSKDYELVRKMYQEENASKNYAIWGKGLEGMLLDNVRGNCDSWAVFWALRVILDEGVCINPYDSLIRNIGLDGSGVHCGDTDQYDVKLSCENKSTFRLPDQVEIFPNTVEAFAPLFGSDTVISRDRESKEKILLYGAGGFFVQNENVVNRQFYIIAFIDRKKHGWFAGRKIIQTDQITNYTYDKIVIMIQDEQECISVKQQLTECGIAREKILIGHDLLRQRHSCKTEFS